MRRRKLRWLVAGAVAAMAGVAAFVLWPRAERVTRENFARIRKGMARAEVEAILGPPGDYTTGPVLPYDWLEMQRATRLRAEEDAHPGEHNGAHWVSDTAWIWIEFDHAGKVVPSRSCLMRVGREDQGPLQVILWRLERQWRRWFPEP